MISVYLLLDLFTLLSSLSHTNLMSVQLCCHDVHHVQDVENALNALAALCNEMNLQIEQARAGKLHVAVVFVPDAQQQVLQRHVVIIYEAVAP